MLFSVADYKTRFNITATSQDAQIDVLRRHVSALASDHCNREFEDSGNDETEFLDGDGTPFIAVKKPPIISIAGIYIDALRTFDSSTLLTTDAYEIMQEGRQRDQGLIRLLEGAEWLPQMATLYGGRFPCMSRCIKVVYRGGFRSIPLGLKEAAMRWAFTLSGHAPGVTSETIGAYSVSYAQSSIDSAVPPDVRAMLAPYVRVGMRRVIS